MAKIYNPFLDENENHERNHESTKTEPARRIQIKRPEAATTAQETVKPATNAPVIATPNRTGQFQKGVPNPYHKGTPRARVTEHTAPILAFIAMFPGATTETCSLITVTKASNIDAGGKNRSIRGTEDLLKKFKKLGLVESFKMNQDPYGSTYWFATEDGVGVAESFGYLDRPNAGHPNGLIGTAYTHLEHNRFIALVAAQLINPLGTLTKELQLPKIGMNKLVSEREIRADFGTQQKLINDAKKDGGEADWGVRRQAMLEADLDLIKSGKLEWAWLLEKSPALRVAGLPKRRFSNGAVKTQHVPDLVIDLAGNVKQGASQVMVEIELSRKTWDEYTSLLRIYKHEVEHRSIYRKVIYFTTRRDIIATLKKIDASNEFGLFESKRLEAHLLNDWDGEPAKLKKRVGD